MRHSIGYLGIITGILLLAGSARGDEPSLQVGDLVPEFHGIDDRGQAWNSRDHVGQRVQVIYFYPSDFSFCCTRQAERYRDCRLNLAGMDVDVIGVSGDSVEAHHMFQTTHKLGFRLLSDGDGQMARRFGVPLRVGGKAVVPLAGGGVGEFQRDFTAARWTFVVGKEGRILYRETSVSPARDSQEVLDFLCNLGSE